MKNNFNFIESQVEELCEILEQLDKHPDWCSKDPETGLYIVRNDIPEEIQAYLNRKNYLMTNFDEEMGYVPYIAPDDED